MKTILGVILAVALLLSIGRAEEQIPLKDQKAKDSYSLGYEFGVNLKRQGVEIDEDILLAAVREALKGKKPLLEYKEIRETLAQLRKKVIVLQDHRVREEAARNLEEGKAFLETNQKKPGVITLPSGLQYRVLREGSGLTPKETDSVSVHYRGTLTDGTEFDSSARRGKPASFSVQSVIKGWTEALQLMKAGSKWQIFVPADLGYGQRRFGRIPPNSTLIFEIELLAVAHNFGAAAAESTTAINNQNQGDEGEISGPLSN